MKEERDVIGRPALRALVASDSFKGSATSARVNELVARGIKRVLPQAEVTCLAVADGGEGTLDALVGARGGVIQRETVRGPLGAPVDARYGLIEGGRTAVIEMAEAAGITLSGRSSSDALAASTYGVGELILKALDLGARQIVVGLGGSATSDGGAGMAQALGARLLDGRGGQVGPGVAGLAELASLDLSGLDDRLTHCELLALTDVTNPLCGPLGAVQVYGPQKGISASDVLDADGWLRGYGQLLEQALSLPLLDAPGAGAAGGLGAGLVAFCGARIVSGVDYVLDAIGLDQALRDADLVVTGEGHMDAQTARGKTPVGVARRAKAQGKPVIAVVGGRADDLDEVYAAGIDLVVPTTIAPRDLEERLARTDIDLPLAGETVVRAYMLGVTGRCQRTIPKTRDENGSC